MVFNDRSLKDGEQFPAEVHRLLTEYRSVLPEADASAEFMPKLWEKIDGHQKVTYSFRRLASGFVTAAAAICLLMTAVTISPSPVTPLKAHTYVEMLTDDTADDATADPAPSYI